MIDSLHSQWKNQSRASCSHGSPKKQFVFTDKIFCWAFVTELSKYGRVNVLKYSKVKYAVLYFYISDSFILLFHSILNGNIVLFTHITFTFTKNTSFKAYDALL